MMKTGGFIMASAFFLMVTACNSNVVMLPENDEAQSWLLFDENPGASVFNRNEAVVSNTEVTRLRALPLTREQLGLQGQVDTRGGRTIPGIASYALMDREWTEIEDTAVRAPFDRTVCRDSCLRMTPCDGCDDGAIQGCGPCDAVDVIPPMPPAQDCPPQWSLQPAVDGYVECTMDRVSGDDAPCGPEQRWSVIEGGCVDFELCSPPVVDSTLLTLYVDPAAAPGGDGSSASPFNDVPSRSQADALILRPGMYPNLVEIEQDGLRLFGHGLCTHLSGGLVVNAQDVSIESLRVESTATTLNVRPSASVTVSNTIIEGDGWVVTSSGSLYLEDSLVTAIDPLSNSIRTDGQVGLHNSDLSLPARMNGVVSVTDTRFLLNQDDQILTSGSSVTIARSVVLGGGVRLESVQAVVTDLLRDTLLSRFAALELTGSDGRVERSDISARTAGIWISNSHTEVKQVRLRSREGIMTEGTPQGRSDRVVVVDRAWIESAQQAIYFVGQQLEINDLWARRRPGELALAGMVHVEDGDVILRRVFLTGFEVNGVFVQVDADIEDYDYRGDRRGFVGPNRLSQGDGHVRGRRWRIEGAREGASLPRSFDLEDIDVKPRPGEDLSLVPVQSTLDDQSDCRLARFRLVPFPAGEPSIRMIATDDAPGWTLLVEDGELPSTLVSVETNPGADLEALEARVRYNNIRLGIR